MNANKTDQRAADRLLRRAVQVAVEDLRNVKDPQRYVYATARNEDRFAVAIKAAALFVQGSGVPQQRQPQEVAQA